MLSCSAALSCREPSQLSQLFFLFRTRIASTAPENSVFWLCLALPLFIPFLSKLEENSCGLWRGLQLHWFSIHFDLGELNYWKLKF